MKLLNVVSVALLAMSVSTKAFAADDPAIIKIYNWISNSHEASNSNGYYSLYLNGKDDSGAPCNLSLNASQNKNDYNITAYQMTAEKIPVAVNNSGHFSPYEPRLTKNIPSYQYRYIQATLQATTASWTSLNPSKEAHATEQLWDVTNDNSYNSKNNPNKFDETATKLAKDIVATDTTLGFSFVFKSKPNRYNELTDRDPKSLSADVRVEWDLDADGKAVESRGYDLSAADPTKPVSVCHFGGKN